MFKKSPEELKNYLIKVCPALTELLRNNLVDLSKLNKTPTESDTNHYYAYILFLAIMGIKEETFKELQALYPELVSESICDGVSYDIAFHNTVITIIPSTDKKYEGFNMVYLFVGYEFDFGEFDRLLGRIFFLENNQYWYNAGVKVKWLFKNLEKNLPILKDEESLKSGGDDITLDSLQRMEKSVNYYFFWHDIEFEKSCKTII